MADFKTAYKKIEAAEGGYCFDPDDAGGETYKGISRRANPNWNGWISIDAIKKAHPTTFKGILKKLPNLKRKFKTFIKTNIGIVLNLMMFQINLLLSKCLTLLLIKVRLLLLNLLNVCLTLEKLVNGRLTF